MLKVIISGANGQLGKTLSKKLMGKHKILALNKTQLDICSETKISDIFADFRPDIFVNCAAYTGVDLAETQRKIALEVNAKSLNYICKECKKNNTKLFHFSTDYVFQGNSSKPYQENDEVNPINYYGLTKSIGEEIICSKLKNYFIFRIAWLYSMDGHSFLKTMIKKLKKSETFKVVNDQFGTPTSTNFVSDVVVDFLSKNELKAKPGLYHISPNGMCSWYEFANAIKHEMKEHNNKLPIILPISSELYVTPAKRPKYSVLNNDKIKKQLNFKIEDWQIYLKNEFKSKQI